MPRPSRRHVLRMVSIDPRLHCAIKLADEARGASSVAALLGATISAVRLAGNRMLERFDPHVRTPADRAAVVQAIHDNDEASLDVARDLLQRARPGAAWVEDELEGGALLDGEHWVVDPVEGNVNHVHGLGEWGVSATLVRDNRPYLTVVHEPIPDRLYTAVAGSGMACADGVPMRPSNKREIDAAIVATGQARPGESADTHRRIGESLRAMLDAALVVRATVPATFQLALVAGGHIDAFWQHSNVRSGLAAGALLVAEAGGIVTDLEGAPWTFGSAEFLAAAPAVHGAVLGVLRGAARGGTARRL